MASLISRGWSVDPAARPTFAEICHELAAEVSAEYEEIGSSPLWRDMSKAYLRFYRIKWSDSEPTKTSVCFFRNISMNVTHAVTKYATEIHNFLWKQRECSLKKRIIQLSGRILTLTGGFRMDDTL
jgi:hypothetical protein